MGFTCVFNLRHHLGLALADRENRYFWPELPPPGVGKLIGILKG